MERRFYFKGEIKPLHPQIVTSVFKITNLNTSPQTINKLLYRYMYIQLKFSNLD